MICYNCHQKFILKRGFLQLFDTHRYYICDQCKKNYPYQPSVTRIPLESFELAIVSIFKNVYQLNLNAFVLEISKIVHSMLYAHRNYFLVFLDEIRLTDELIEIMSFLADSVEKNILLVTCCLKK